MFQFQNGAIASAGIIEGLCRKRAVSIPKWCDCKKRCFLQRVGMHRSFNSKMVRLQVRSSEFWQLGPNEFQFQNGAIARRHLQGLRSGLICFNSKMVRLQEMRYLPSRVSGESFNSKMVRLQVYLVESVDKLPHSFNSKMVRLQAAYDALFSANAVCFNSKMVRLQEFKPS